MGERALLVALLLLLLAPLALAWTPEGGWCPDPDDDNYCDDPCRTGGDCTEAHLCTYSGTEPEHFSCGSDIVCISPECIGGVCTKTPKCDDNDDCTLDECDPFGTCIWPRPDLCDSCFGGCAPQVCNSVSCVGVTCVYTPLANEPQPGCDNDGPGCITQTCLDGSCIYVSECDDNNRCTQDNCFAGTCSNTAISCNDGLACTSDRCDPITGCYHVDACADANPCTDDRCSWFGKYCINEPISGSVPGCDGNPDPSNLCIISSCVSGVCQEVPVNINDGEVCTLDTCDPATGIVTHTPLNGEVQGCSGYTTLYEYKTCENGVCVVKETPSCSRDQDCEDNNPCTTHYCDQLARGGPKCAYEKLEDGPQTGCFNLTKECVTEMCLSGFCVNVSIDSSNPAHSTIPNLCLKEKCHTAACVLNGVTQISTCTRDYIFGCCNPNGAIDPGETCCPDNSCCACPLGSTWNSLTECCEPDDVVCVAVPLMASCSEEYRVPLTGACCPEGSPWEESCNACSPDGGTTCDSIFVPGPVCPPQTPWDPYRQACCEAAECMSRDCDQGCINGECIDLKATGMLGAPNWDAWIPFVLIALLIGYLLAAIAYMASQLITSPELYAWAKNEFYEVSASAWFVGATIFFIGVLNLMLVELGGANLVETASLYTARVSSDILTIYSVIVQGLFALGLFSYLGGQFGIGVPIGPVIIGVQGGAYPFGGLVPVMQALGTVTNMLSFGMFAIILQRELLGFVADTMLRVLLPIGIFLRCFTFTRKIGATIMAFAVGMYVVYPLTLIMNAEIYDSVPRLPQVEYQKDFPIKDFDVSPWMGVAMGPNFKKYCQHWYDWVAFCWLRAILAWIFAFIKALILMTAFVIKTLYYALSVGVTGFSSDAFGYFVNLVPWAIQPMIAALFLPVLDIIIVFTAIRSLSEAIGGETRISGLLEFI